MTSDGSPSNTPPRFYAMANTEIEPLRASITAHDGVSLASLDPSATLDQQRHVYPPEETAEERTNRLRDDFEGWNRDREEFWTDDGDGEVEQEEVERRRNDRVGKEKGGRSWGEWWEKEM